MAKREARNARRARLSLIGQKIRRAPKPKRKKLRDRVLHLIQTGCANVAEVAEIMGISRNAARSHVTRLKASGLVVSAGRCEYARETRTGTAMEFLLAKGGWHEAQYE